MSHFQPAGQQLTVDDLRVVMKELNDVCAKWYNIGVHLGVRVGALDAIEKQYSDPTDCLRRTLTTWLKSSTPTWSNIVDALNVVGEVRLATDLQHKYCSSTPVSPAPITSQLTTPQLVASTTAPPLLQPFPITGDSTPPDTPPSPQPHTVTTHSHPPTPTHTGMAIRIHCLSCMQPCTTDYKIASVTWYVGWISIPLFMYISLFQLNQPRHCQAPPGHQDLDICSVMVSV